MQIPCRVCITPIEPGEKCPNGCGSVDSRKAEHTKLVYGSPEYRKARGELMANARFCELRLEGCTWLADSADHVIPVSEMVDHSQLRAACAHCNSKRGNTNVR